SIWLVTSDGTLYETAEGRDGARVNYTRHRTGVDCEVEGLAYDPSLDALLLACKHVGRRQRGKLVVYRWALWGDKDSRLTSLMVSLPDLLRQTTWREFHPSGIEVDPRTGDYVIISSLDHALIEITPDGRRVRALALPPARHAQPEGVTFTLDGMLLIIDEARGRTPWLTVYRWR
ncbi:MAG: SdiA-regulated domain-containing protein, partial [Gemmatimonadales bacterium]